MKTHPIPPSRCHPEKIRVLADLFPEHLSFARRESGAALVFVLAMLVLVLTVVLAFFSRATLNRQIASSSVANTKVQLISQTAEAYVLDDFQREIAAGSVADTNAALTVQIRRPITLTNVGIGVTNTWAPSMVPQRVGDAGITNIVKVSRRGLAFFTNGDGYTSNGATRATDISTTNVSANGRFLTKDRWNLPKLMADSETNAFVAPDWIYIDRQGNTPTNFSALPAMASTAATNTNYVIGRYAYVVYDVGGLLDINVVGNALPSTNNAVRGLAHQVSLSNGIGGVAVPNFTNFVAWRSAVSSTNTNAASGSGGLFDPKRNFIDVPASEQAFVNRQDLLNYVAQPGSPIPSAALPFLTAFSRDLNAPSYEPNPSRPMTVRAMMGSTPPVATEMNPALLSIRFSTDTTLHRPEGNCTVKSGTPVMPRRFPLSKLSLFEEPNPDPAAMLYYFGLKKENDTWRYTATTTGGRIAMLSEIPALGREPNFFEILQAVIYTGSLGMSAPDANTFEEAEDKLQNLQVMPNGANIIDQTDPADTPTAIEFPSGVPNDFFTVYGVENLPYISQIGAVGWRPTDNQNLFQAWAVFDVWNPHQNAWNGDPNVTKKPVGVDGFRIVPIGGRGRVILSYYLVLPQTLPPAILKLRDTLSGYVPESGGCAFQSNQPLLILNPKLTFTFPATGNYTEPTTLGGTRNAPADPPGLLLAECTPGVAIPALADRDPTEDRTTTLAALEAGLGATFGVKAYNTFRLKSNSFPDDWSFALQAHYTGDPETVWHTYQVIEGFGGPGLQLDTSVSPVGGEAQAAMTVNTDHSAAGALLQNEYYQWRSRGASIGMVKTDPRTNRLGFSGWSQASSSTTGNDFLGYSARFSADPLPASLLNDTGGGLINNDYRWAVPGGTEISGLACNLMAPLDDMSLAPGFELLPELRSSAQRNRYKVPLFGLVSNSPEALDANRPFRYSDPDGVVRPADGYFGTLPTVPGRAAERPLMLNRPFRSVGELGYVFRDLPWKTVDLFSRNSADLGLLDVFSVSETSDPTPLVAGRINLNTRQPAVLAAALRGSAEQLVPATELAPALANSLAEEIVKESTVRPFFARSDLITRVLHRTPDPLAGKTSKTAREAAVRALGEIGTVRTWNFLIDMVVQSGRFTSNSKSGADFMVNAERREWIHVAIDRMTGEILEQRKEVVNE